MPNDLAVNTDRIAVVFPEQAEIYNVIAAETITEGEALYQTIIGTFGIADANDSGKEQFRGIALETAVSGTVLSMLKQGTLAGYTLPNPDNIIYLSDTAGNLADAAGSMTVAVGRVTVLADPDATEVLYIEADWLNDWS